MPLRYTAIVCESMNIRMAWMPLSYTAMNTKEGSPPEVDVPLTQNPVPSAI
jgi:hypothetical protein